MLRNPYYIGVVKFRGVEHQGDHPRFVPSELFEQVQQVLTAHAVAGEKQWKHEHYLKGTVYCGLCRRRLIFTKCTGRGGVRYAYFVCGTRHEGGSCELPYLPAHSVEHHIGEYYLREVKLNADRVAGLQPRLVELFRLSTAHREREAERARRTVEDLLGQRRQLVADHVKNPGAIPLDVLEEQQAELGQRLASAQRDLQKAEADVGRAEEGLELARRFLERSSATYRNEADPQTRRRWNQVFFRRLFVGPQGIVAAELTDEFGALLAEELTAEVEKFASDAEAFRAHDSNVERLVELAGLEPALAQVPWRSKSTTTPNEGSSSGRNSPEESLPPSERRLRRLGIVHNRRPSWRCAPSRRPSRPTPG